MQKKCLTKFNITLEKNLSKLGIEEHFLNLMKDLGLKTYS